jgi:hypothetical protein
VLFRSPDPAKFVGTDAQIREEFLKICNMLEERIGKMLELPVEKIEKAELQRALSNIGKE